MKNNKNYMTKLLQTVKNKSSLLIYLKNKQDEEYEFYDTFKYNETKKIYQGQFGYLDLEIIIEIIAGNEEYNHIKLEVVE